MYLWQCTGHPDVGRVLLVKYKNKVDDDEIFQPNLPRDASNALVSIKGVAGEHGVNVVNSLTNHGC